MGTELLSIAYIWPEAGKDEETAQVLKELYSLLRRKAYSRDLLYHDPKSRSRYINVRVWNSEQQQREAAEDPEIHRYWVRLPEVLEMRAVYERLESVPGFPSQFGPEPPQEQQ